MQTIALAGDFFGVPDAPISDGASDDDRQSRFLDAWRTLNLADPQMIAAILAVMHEQADAVTNLVNNSTASDRYSQAYTQLNADYQYDLAYNAASRSGLLDVEGSYMELAGTNWDHFGHHAVAAYSAGHAVAIAQAQFAAQQQSQAILQRAYLLEAFAAHFLSDLFATGHLRTPRKALHDSISPFPDLLAQMMHDEDNYNGMMVSSNEHPHGWLAYGDKRSGDTPNGTNRSYAQAALQASINEIWNAYQGTLPASYVALDHIPNLDSAFDTKNHSNWSPLFVVSQSDEDEGNLDEVAIRDGMLDLTSRTWSTMDAWYVPPGTPIYAGAWYALPSGGVHSVEGAPPYQLQQWAHPFTWSQYQSVKLDGSSGGVVKNAMSPAAVILSDPTPPPVIVDDPSQLPDHGDNVLHLFVRQSGSSAILHLTTPMSNVPSFGASCVQQPTDPLWSTNGQPAAIAMDGMIAVLYPASDGSVVQRVTQPSGGWSTPTAIFGATGTYKMNASGCVALAKSGASLYAAYRGSDGNLWCAVGKMPSAGQCIWRAPTQVQIGGKAVPLTIDPGLIVFDGYLVVSASVSTDGPNPIRIWRCPLDANPMFSAFQLYLDGLKDSSRNALTTKHIAQLFDYADGYSVVGTNDGNDRIETIVPVQATNPTGSWLMKNIIIGGVPLKTTSRVSTLFFQGNPYVFYSDSATNNQLSVVTSATMQVD
jgi:hypothetical protein